MNIGNFVKSDTHTDQQVEPFLQIPYFIITLNQHRLPQCFAAGYRRCLSPRRSNNAAFNVAVS